MTAAPEIAPKRRGGFASLTREQRQEYARKAHEARRRNAAARAGTARPAKGRRVREGAPRRGGKAALSKAAVQMYLQMALGAFAGAYDLPTPEIPQAQLAGLTDEQRAAVIGNVERAAQAQRQMLAALRAWCPPEDRLNEEEVHLLSDVGSDELVKHPQIFAPFLKAAKHAGELRLPLAVVAVALPRLARHMVIPGVVAHLLHGPVTAAAMGRVPTITADAVPPFRPEEEAPTEEPPEREPDPEPEGEPERDGEE